MNRIYLFLALSMGITSAATAQTRNINLESKIVKPANGSTITGGTNLNVEYTFTNKGPAAIKAGDTLVYADPFNQPNQVWIRVLTADKNMNDTISIKRTYPVSTNIQNGTNLQYCIVAGVWKGSANTPIQETDTSNNDACNTGITVTGGTNSVAGVKLKDGGVKEGLAIVPNPASFDVKFDFVSNSAAEVKARVIDVTGREVYNHSFGKAYVGQTNYGLNISGLNNGIYFVELSQESRRAIGKMIKQ